MIKMKLFHRLIFSTLLIIFNVGICSSQRMISETIKCGNQFCRPVTGIFTKNPIISGYTHVTTIPKGASNITITELKSSPNLLVLRTSDGNYITNGNFSVSPSGIYEAAAAQFDYRRLDSLLINVTDYLGQDDESVTEWITSTGPTNEDVQLLILAKHHNPGIKYEYWIPVLNGYSTSEEDYYSSNEDISSNYRHTLKSADSATTRPQIRRRKFMWKIMGFTSCSKPCGGGTQTPIIKCVRENPTRMFNPKRCAHLKQPELHENMMKCNTQPCPAYWKILDWSECQCSTENGNTNQGFRSRQIKCVQELMPGIVIQHNPVACNSEDEPAKREKCDCSQNRVHFKPESILNRPSVHRGKNRKKIEIETKRNGAWLSAPWAENCSSVCGVGLIHRTIFCDRSTSHAERCDLRITPDTSKECSSNEKCSFGEWFVGPWSKCAGDCFNLSKGRAIICIRNDAFADDDECDPLERPVAVEKCLMNEVDYCKPQWHYSDWSECSKKCGGGTQRRTVKCVEPNISEGTMKESQSCRYAERESIYRVCNEQKCHFPQTTTSTTTEAYIDPKVEMIQSDAACVDDFPNCHLVIKAKLCSYAYYNNHCCQTCKIKTNEIY